jgi:hypothetical protein
MSYILQDSVKILQSVKKMNDQYKLLKYKAFFFFFENQSTNESPVEVNPFPSHLVQGKIPKLVKMCF